MSWFIVNGISAGLTILLFGIFVITTRKLAGTIRLGQELAHQIQLARASLEQAGALLQQEHQKVRHENSKLGEQIRESTRIRSNISRSLIYMEQMHTQLQKRFNQLNNTPGMPAKTGPMPAPTVIQPLQREKNGLPVFVQRKVTKASINNVIKL